MDSNPNETRPLKRRRMEMAPPDGFTTTATIARKPVYKPVVPQFSSAFEGDHTSDLTSTGSFKPSSSSTDNLKECRPVLSNSSIIEGADKPKERKVLHALVPSKPDTRFFTLRTPKEWSSTFLPALHGSLISSQLKIDAPILQLRPPPKPPIMPSYHTPITTSALLKPAVPPPPLLSNKQHPKDLRSLQPPIVPPNPAINVKSLHTISNTRVALATDLSTDSGVAELASIFLHYQHSDISLLNPDDYDGRSLGLSPEKKRKGKIKLVRYALFYCLGKGLDSPYMFCQGWLSSSCICFFRTVSDLSRLMAKRNGTSCKHIFILRFTRKHHQDPSKAASFRSKTNFSWHSSLSNPAWDK